MKKIELLAPVGNMECLKYAVMAGCDAVYLAGKSFGARAFSKNFTDLEIIEAIKYAHLYGVKVYITVNTLIYDDEVDEFIKYIKFIHRNNVDAIIIQDIGMLDLVRKTFPELEIHASTQMHIHNLDGTLLMEKLGVKRVVLARETSINDIRYIKENSDIELEIFIHGALCVSYSGQCLMSSLIGGRSGNRGACAGSCRLKYDVINDKGEKLNKFEYPLSTKDLNCLENIGELIDIGVSSLKIEGRMKSKEYVYMVVSIYREAIDSYYKYGKVIINNDKLLKLKKIFNREYTKGFIFNDSNKSFINGYRSNHMGVNIGKVIDYNNGYVKIKLTDKLVIGSGLRIIGNKNDVGVLVNDFYIDKKLVKEANCGDVISIKVNDKVDINSKVVVTLDKSINDGIDNEIMNNPRKVMISGKFIGRINNKIYLSLSDGANKIEVFGNRCEMAVKRDTSKEEIISKLEKLGDTVYEFSDLDVAIDDGIFIPMSDVNDLRRKAISLLNEKRLYETKFVKESYYIDVPDFKRERIKSVLVDSDNLSKIDRDYDIVYSYRDMDRCIKKYPRVIREYPDKISNVLVGEIGAFYRGENLYTDFSLNVVNSYTVAFLHSMGAKRITLSYELNDYQIDNLIRCYIDRYGKYPNLELIVDSYEEVMICKFNLFDYYNYDKLWLRDMFGNRYKIKVRDRLMYIYNYKKRDIYSDKYYEMGINSLRVNLDN